MGAMRLSTFPKLLVISLCVLFLPGCAQILEELDKLAALEQVLMPQHPYRTSKMQTYLRLVHGLFWLILMQTTTWRTGVKDIEEMRLATAKAGAPKKSMSYLTESLVIQRQR